MALRSALAETGQQAVARMRAQTDTAAFANSPGYPALVDQLDEAWKARLAAATAIVTYAEALEAVTDAGKSGSEAVEAVVNGVKGLAEAAGLALPGAGAAAGVATDVAKFVYAQIALARAADTLAEALERAQPAVARIAQILRQDIDDLSAILQTVALAERNALRTQHQIELGFRDSLVERRDALYAQSGALDAPARTTLAALLRERERLQRKEDRTEAEEQRLTAIEAEVADLYQAAGALTPAERDELLALEQHLQAMQVWHGPLQRRLDAIEIRRRAEHELLTVASEAIDDWANRHDALRRAVAEGRKQPVSAEAVLDAAKQIKALVDRMRDL